MTKKMFPQLKTLTRELETSKRLWYVYSSKFWHKAVFQISQRIVLMHLQKICTSTIPLPSYELTLSIEDLLWGQTLY